MDAWLRPVEQIVLPALDGKIRVLGITAPHHGVGVSALSAATARTLARSGSKVLLLDFTQSVKADAPTATWAPGEGNAASRVRKHPSGYDVLTAEPTPETRFLFNNGKRLRRTLFEDLSEYAVIVTDLPPLVEDRTDHLNAIAVALACDQVIMVCANGRTPRAAARAATEAARNAGVRLTGAVWNDFGTPKLGLDMARSARRLFWFLPPLGRLLERRLQRSAFLNG